MKTEAEIKQENIELTEALGMDPGFRQRKEDKEGIQEVNIQLKGIKEKVTELLTLNTLRHEN